MLVSRHQVAVFQALSDPTRLAIFDRLSQGECSVTQLTSKFDVSQPAISQHLAILQQCSLVRNRKEGRHRIYSARPEGLEPIESWLRHYRKFWPQRIEKLKDILKQESERNERTGID